MLRRILSASILAAMLVGGAWSPSKNANAYYGYVYDPYSSALGYWAPRTGYYYRGAPYYPGYGPPYTNRFAPPYDQGSGPPYTTNFGRDYLPRGGYYMPPAYQYGAYSGYYPGY
jgi:hypothetical protein